MFLECTTLGNPVVLDGKGLVHLFYKHQQLALSFLGDPLMKVP